MKNNLFKTIILLLCVFFFNSEKGFSQKKTTNKKKETITTIIIDLNSQILLKDYTLPKGGYNVVIIDKNDSTLTHQIIISETTVPISLIDIESNNSFRNPPSYKVIETYKFTLKERSKIEFSIKKMKNSIMISEFRYTFKSKITHKWHTTLGIAGIALLKTDTYKTSAFGDGYIITQDGSQNLVDPVIVMMFTYINLEKSYSIGPTGGIGFDLEKISVYGGASWYLGHNLVLTGGVALHQQLRLDNKYDVGQIVDSPINSDDLNSFYYRVNPFISLTFALSKNIFKK